MKIKSLTKEQIARFPEFVQKWTQIGLSTEPANRREAEIGITEAYHVAGLEKPMIVWCGSPLAQGLTRALVFNLEKSGLQIAASVRASVGASVMDSVWASVMASVWDSVGDSVMASVRDSVWDSVMASVGASVRDSVRDSVWASVRDSVWASVRDSVGDSVMASVGDSVWASVRDSVGASVRDSVRDSVGDSVRDSVWASVRDSVRDSVWDSVWASVCGQHDAGWLSFYDFFRVAAALDTETNKLCGILRVAQSAGWWLLHEKICWVAERHTTLKRDDQGRLHCETGPAVQYPDGWSIYASHGVRLPSWIVERPVEISVANIDSENNAEIRRVMIEKFGRQRWIKESGSTLIHSDDFGALFRRHFPDGREDVCFVEVINSTPEPDGSFKNYVLRVPPGMRTARQAVAWTFNLDAEQYAPAIET